MLKSICAAAILGLLGISSYTLAGGDVDVKFEGSGRYTDAFLQRSHADGLIDEQVAKQFTSTLQGLGLKYLRDGEKLYIVIENVDLAGRFDPFTVNASHVRFKNELYWPKVALRYVLVRPGQPDVSRDVDVVDRDYLNKAGVSLSSDQLKSEKSMLRDWFRQEFGNAEVTMM